MYVPLFPLVTGIAISVYAMAQVVSSDLGHMVVSLAPMTEVTDNLAASP